MPRHFVTFETLVGWNPFNTEAQVFRSFLGLAIDFWLLFSVASQWQLLGCHNLKLMVAFYTGILYHILSLTIKFQILKMIKGRTFENNTISDRFCQLTKIIEIDKKRKGTAFECFKSFFFNFPES